METRPKTRHEVERWIERHPVAGSADEMREAFAKLAGADGGATPWRLGSVEVLRFGQGPRCLWFHGGGYVFGSPQTHSLVAAWLAEGGIEVLVPRYRLAPEAQWPAMLEDAVAAIDALDGPLVLAGDSAGGHLALVAAMERPEKVSGVAVLSPNTDRTGLSGTRTALGAVDLMNDDEGDEALAREAFGDLSPQLWEVSPVLGPLERIAALHIEVGAHEVLLGDSLALAEHAAVKGTPCALHMSAGLFHMAHLWADALPPARAQLDRIAAFVRARIEPGAP